MTTASAGEADTKGQGPGGLRLRWAGLALAAVGVLVAAATVALDVRNRGAAVPEGVGLDPGWITAAPGLALLLPGVLLQRHLPRHPIAWVLIVFGMLWLLDALAAAWLVYAAYTAPGTAGGSLAFWYYIRFGGALLLGVPMLLLLFPDGRLPAGRWRVAAIASLACTALLPVAVMLVPSRAAIAVNGPLPPPLDRLAVDPVSVPLPDAVWRVVLPGAYALAAASLLVPLAVVVHRYRRSDGEARAQLRWLAWAALVDALVLLANAVLPSTFASVLLSASIAVTAGAVVVAVTRYRLYAIDRLLGATVVYTLLALAVVGLDLAVFAIAGTVLGERNAALAAVAVVAVVYAPLRGRLWAVVRRGLRGGREDRYGVVSVLGERLEGSGTAEEQLLAVARTVADAFRSPFVLMEVQQVGGETLAVRYGDPDAEAPTRVVLPVTYRAEQIGQLILAPRGAGPTRLTERDQRLLGDVIRQAAAAARATALSEQLQRSRGEIVAGREEERRRLRRDLHDGLGPSLAAVTLRIETARNLARTSPQAADAMLEQATDDVAAVLADVRRLVHDLRPPALDELGLSGAVTQLARRFDGSPAPGRLAVRVEVCGELAGLPAAVEVAVYRIVSEALTNVVRHASARTCRVGLTRREQELEVSVEDDGVGISPGVPAGVGLVSLRERAAELGGRCEVGCPASGGTVVRAVLPLPSVSASSARLPRPDG